MEWGDSANLLWLWLVVPVIVAGVFSWRLRMRRLLRFSSWSMDRITTRRVSKAAWVGKLVLVVLAVIALILALAKPRLGFQWLQVKSKGVDVLVAVDVSKSMLAEDIQPSRLERAKREILDFLNLVAGDRVGLMAFAGVPFVQCPLTVDYGAVAMFLEYLSPELIPVPGTAIGLTIDRAVTSFEEAANEHSQGRALILITDGEDHDEDTLVKAAQRAQAADVKIYIVGIGNAEGAPIPLRGGGFLKDQKGNVVVSKLDEKGLKKLASLTGGRYVRSTAGDLDLDLIYRQGIKDTLEDQEFDAKRRKLWFERFRWFVGLAFVLLLIEALWRGHGRAAVQTVLILSLIGLSPAADAADLRGAHSDFEEKNYESAAKKFEEAEIDDPDNLEHSYNRAVSQYRQGDFDGARQGFSRSAQSDDKKLSGRSLYNLGNTEFRLGNLEGAVSAFEETLKIDPDDVEAKENLELVRRLLEEQKKQKQKGEGEDNDQKNGDQSQEGQQQNQSGEKKQDGQQNQSGQSQPNQDPSRDQNTGERSEGEEGDKQDGEEQKEQEQDGHDKDGAAASQDQDEGQEAGRTQQPRAATMDEKAAKRTLESVEDAAGKYLGRPAREDIEKARNSYRGRDW